MKPKLSPAQVKVLRKMAVKGTVAVFMDNFKMPSYWFYNLHRGRIRVDTMQNLMLAGFVCERSPDHATITPAGLSYLAQLDKEKNDEK